MPLLILIILIIFNQGNLILFCQIENQFNIETFFFLMSWETFMKLTKVITKPNSKWTKYQRITLKKKQRKKKKKEKTLLNP